MLFRMWRGRVRDDRGSFEVLVGLLLCSVMGVLLCGYWASTASVVKEVQKEVQAASARLRVEALTRMVIRDVDRHRLPLLPVIHPAGELHLSNGLLHPLSERSDLLGISERSQPLSYFEIESPTPLRVSRVLRVRGDEATVIVCSKRGMSIAVQSRRSFLALFADGVVLLSGEVIEGDGECATVVLQLAPSPALHFTVSPPIEICRSLISLRRVYTVYVDRGGTLRLVTHRGEEWSAPQPLATRARDLRFEVQSLGEGELLYGLQGRFLDGSHTEKVFSRLSRQPVYNTLFYREG
jgi:hypothetical protein